MTMSGFLYFWSWVFLVTTTAVWMLKREDVGGKREEEEPDLGVAETYHVLTKILRLPAVQATAIFLLTSKVGF